jgi:hypothetical protein
MTQLPTAFASSGPWLILGCVLLVALLTGIGAVLLARRVSKAQARKAAEAPLSSARQPDKLPGRFVFGLFAVLGLALLVPFFILPVWRVREARSWIETPCVVISSHVEVHRDSDGSTYRPVIVYEYQFQGRTYQGNRYNFMGGSSSGRAGKQAVVDRYPPGAAARCWVNPREPSQAVLNRGFAGEMLFGLIPLVFALVGMGGLVGMRRQAVAETAPSPPTILLDAEARELRPGASRWGKVFGMFAVAAFWNGITWTILIAASRDREWFALAFLSLFALIGAGLLAAVVYLALALANPRPRLTLRPGALRLGALQTLAWHLTGAVARLRHLVITLEGRESATYTRGTSTVTDRRACLRVVLAEVANPAEMRQGETSFEPPAGMVPGFKADCNKLEWFLRVRGDIPFWPDLDEEFPVEINAEATDPAAARQAETGPALVRSADGALALGTEGARTAYAPGETLSGVAGWQLEAPPRQAEVRLLWYTQGKGTRDVRVVDVVQFERPAARETRPFMFQLPLQPWSMDGGLISVLWALELVIEPGARNARYDLVLSPTGAAVPLAESVPDDPALPAWARWLKPTK